MANANNAPVGLVLELSPQEAEMQGNLGQNLNSAQMKMGSRLVRNAKQIAKGVYDFAVQGGVIGNINLYDARFAPGVSAMPGLAQLDNVTPKGVFKPLILPYNAIIVRALLDVLTNPVGVGASVAFSSGVSAGDLKGATAIAGLTGLVDLSPANTAASSIKVVQAVVGARGVIPFIAISGAALTAGKFNVHIEYYLSD